VARLPSSQLTTGISVEVAVVGTPLLQQAVLVAAPVTVVVVVGMVVERSPQAQQSPNRPQAGNPMLS
jgi:hypothetical protein